MKIFIFKDNKEWIEYADYNDFDSFFDDVIQEDCAFKFADCTEEEIDNFLDYIQAKSTCLDDCDYYRFSCDRRTIDTIEDVYIFNDLILYTLDEIIKLTQSHLNYYKELKEKV